MQISAANLLVAGQQPRPADAAKRAGDAFAAALGDGAAKARPAQFSLPSFEAGAPDAAAAPPPVARPAAKPGAGYGALLPPGSKLDIRV